MRGQKVSSLHHLYRRAFGPPDKRFLNPDGSATSRVFKLRPKDNGELSVDVKELTTITAAISDPERFVLFEIPVQSVEDLNLTAIHDPLNHAEHGIDNDAHALILGILEDDDIVPGQLARASSRVSFSTGIDS